MAGDASDSRPSLASLLAPSVMSDVLLYLILIIHI